MEKEVDGGRVLLGAAAIAAFLSEELGHPVLPKRVYHLAEKGHIPCGKWAGQLKSTTTAIRQRLRGDIV